MKKAFLTVIAAFAIAGSAFSHPGPGHFGPGPYMHAPRYAPGPRLPPPPPGRHHHHYHPFRYEPVVAGVLGVGAALLAPRYVWVPGHYEARTLILPDGRTVTTSVWVPGGYVPAR